MRANKKKKNIFNDATLILTFELAVGSSTCKSQTLVSAKSLRGRELFT